VLAASLRLIYVQSGFLDLIPDEAYYWTWAERLAVGYHTKGPVIAWIIRISTALSGHTEFAVRMGAVVASFAGTIITFHLTDKLFKSPRAGFVAVMLVTVAPLFAVGSILMTPDTPLFCFWVLSLYYMVQGLEGKRPRPWYLLGLWMGLGILTKYMMLVFPLLMFGYIAAAPEHKHWLRKSEPYVAVSLALLLCIPLLMWNAQHDWLIISHLTGRGGLTRPGWLPDLQKIGDNAAGQLAVVGPFILGLIIVPFIKLNRWYQETKNPALLMIAWFSIPIIGFFALLGLFKKVEPNWTAIAFLPLIVLAAAWWSREEGESRGRKIILWSNIAVTLLLVLVLHLPSLLMYAGISLPPKMDPTNRFQGWRDLAYHLDDTLEEYPEDMVFVLTENQHIASEVAFYMDALDITFVQPYRQRNTQFQFWPGPNTQIGKDALYVALDNAEIPLEVVKTFDYVGSPSRVRILNKGVLVRCFSVYHCENFRGFP